MSKKDENGGASSPITVGLKPPIIGGGNAEFGSRSKSKSFKV